MGELELCRPRLAAGSRPRRARLSRGFILVDLLVALVIAGVALTAVIAGISHGTRAAAVERQRILRYVENENGRDGTVGSAFDVQ